MCEQWGFFVPSGCPVRLLCVSVCSMSALHVLTWSLGHLAPPFQRGDAGRASPLGAAQPAARGPPAGPCNRCHRRRRRRGSSTSTGLDCQRGDGAQRAKLAVCTMTLTWLTRPRWPCGARRWDHGSDGVAASGALCGAIRCDSEGGGGFKVYCSTIIRYLI